MSHFEYSLNGELKGTLDVFVKEFFKNKYPSLTPKDEEKSTAPSQVAQLFEYGVARYDTEESGQGNGQGNEMGAYFFKEKWDPTYLPQLKVKIRAGLEQGIQRFQKGFQGGDRYNLVRLTRYIGMNEAVRQELTDVFQEMGIEKHIQQWFVTEVVDSFSGYLINAYEIEQAAKRKAYEIEQATKRKQSKKEPATESAAVA